MIKNLIQHFPQILIRYRAWLNAAFQAGLILFSLLLAWLLRFDFELAYRQPLTITHPEIKRFFMITPDAVALVLQAFAIGNNGDILILDMGESVRILDLARSLIRLSGKFEHNVEIKFTGLREGEGALLPS
jgi:hypothetical protein